MEERWRRPTVNQLIDKRGKKIEECDRRGRGIEAGYINLSMVS